MGNWAKVVAVAKLHTVGDLCPVSSCTAQTGQARSGQDPAMSRPTRSYQPMNAQNDLKLKPSALARPRHPASLLGLEALHLVAQVLKPVQMLLVLEALLVPARGSWAWRLGLIQLHRLLLLPQKAQLAPVRVLAQVLQVLLAQMRARRSLVQGPALVPP